MEASPIMEQYFSALNKNVAECYAVAKEARKKGLDPEKEVSILLASNMAERVVGLISVAAPQIGGTGLPERIIELEAVYGLLDWRVGFTIALEVAQEKFCVFKDKQEAMEVGIRVGFAYLTLGIVSAPLEGFIGLKIKKRKDGREYFALQYAGPIRGAGGTAASTSVILADFVRVKMGYAPYDPEEKEVLRYAAEVHDYHDWVTNLQYHPSDEELKYMVSHLPVEVDGDPTEKREVSNYKDLPRIETNLIRGGMALVLAEGLCQKAPKLWKRLSAWGKDFDLDWSFLDDFIKLKVQIHTKQVNKEKSPPEEKKVKPNNTFIMDLVAGRPIITHPLAAGGLRLRYGRTRMTGFSAAALHPATMVVLSKYIAIGTQLKVERPGKAATVTVCDMLEGPIVVLQQGDVLKIKTAEEAKRVFPDIREVLFLGDILFNYGDFSENGHSLVPAGYCLEWWALELKKALEQKEKVKEPLKQQQSEKKSGQKSWQKPGQKNITTITINTERVSLLCSSPFYHVPSLNEAWELSKTLSIPLHPEYTSYWKLVRGADISVLLLWLKEGKVKHDNIKPNNIKPDNIQSEKMRPDGDRLSNAVVHKIVLPYAEKNEIHRAGKNVLENIGLEHQVVNKEMVVLGPVSAQILSRLFGFHTNSELALVQPVDEIDIEKDGLEVINKYSRNNGVKVADKAGTFIGARMGRPEKAKMRSLTGSPQVMFPVGEEGDRLRSFQAALTTGKVRSDFPSRQCLSCNVGSIYLSCQECGGETVLKYHCRFCGDLEKDACRHGPGKAFKTQDLDIKYYFEKALEKVGERTYPDLIKGIRGTSNKNHVVEHLSKGILRAKHQIYVNKDGTTRYDCTELPITHFKPKEIKTSPAKLKTLGYVHDIHGDDLASDDQIVELKPQDIILPGFGSLDESAPKVLFRVAQFLDDLLVRFYGLKPYFNLGKEEDLIGHMVIGLAPHISAGLVGRIIGFSETQGLLAHPMYHAGLRRDCFDKDTYIPLCRRGRWEIKKIGEVVEEFNPTKIVDRFGTKEIKVSGLQTVGNSIVDINKFTKHTPLKFLKVQTKLGRTLKITENHKQIIYEGGKKKVVRASSLKKGDVVGIPYQIKIPVKDVQEINLLSHLKSEGWVMVRGVNALVQMKEYTQRYFKKSDADNFTARDSYPITFIHHLLQKGIIKSTEGLWLAAKHDTVRIPVTIPITDDFLKVVGLYIAEGYSRKVEGRLYQMYIAAENEEVRQFVKQTMFNIFGLTTSENKKDRLTYSSRIVYHLFTIILRCGSSAYEKRFPQMFLNLPLKKVGSILTGYVEGDGSVSKGDLRITFDTVSEGLLRDFDFVFGRMGIFVKNYTYTSLPGEKLRLFYKKKGREIPRFTITKGIIQSIFVKKFAAYIHFISSRKRNILTQLLKKKSTKIRQTYSADMMFDEITDIEHLPEDESYCLNVEGHEVIANSILTRQCDGDEAAVMLLLDGLLNFSRQYLPNTRGATMDSPLVLTSTLDPAEVDDQVHGMDIVWGYPLELYEASLDMKAPWEVLHDGQKIEQLGDRLGSQKQYQGFGFTHDVQDFNKGVQCSAYKTIPSMEEKIVGQMEIAQRVKAVDMDDVARLVIEKHLLRDIKGNLRKFSMQQFRCVSCNAKFRRPPLKGICKCNGRIIFTISEGSVIKYLPHSLLLAEKYSFSPYLKQTLHMLENQVAAVFGKEKEKQVGLAGFIDHNAITP